MAIYRNTATGETYTLGLELRAGETLLAVAWGRGLRAACEATDWNRHDVFVAVAWQRDTPAAAHPRHRQD